MTSIASHPPWWGTVWDRLGERLTSLIRQLGADSFQEREQASAGVVSLGRAALPQLRQAAKDPDPEIAQRAQACVELIESHPEAARIAAATRFVKHGHPEGACSVLLTYLLFATD